jgi:hypothetical protein
LGVLKIERFFIQLYLFFAHPLPYSIKVLYEIKSANLLLSKRRKGVLQTMSVIKIRNTRGPPSKKTIYNMLEGGALTLILAARAGKKLPTV